jgi:hypothetical protein
MERTLVDLKSVIEARIQTGDDFRNAMIEKLKQIKTDMTTAAKEGDAVIDATKLEEYKQKILEATNLLKSSVIAQMGGRRNSRRHSRRKRR